MCIVTRDQEENRVSILIFTTGDYKLLKKNKNFFFFFLVLFPRRDTVEAETKDSHVDNPRVSKVLSFEPRVSFACGQEFYLKG